ncbi:uncharacterized protein N7529_011474 [Penicillium soppii]|uniref:uncharacterized protein n=1 Tax=Penicillium soppii TaxID=69789 RepID=UPI002547255C|nr:uncharacterized protein N7529_011474 [Penicillium soppii]KAJ5852089.1 hypothetical protein N7529_011474 [Penicillium soppii]
MADLAQFDRLVSPEKQGHTILYPTYISLKAFLDAPFPEEKAKVDRMRIHPIRYIKVITAFPVVDKYNDYI